MIMVESKLNYNIYVILEKFAPWNIRRKSQIIKIVLCVQVSFDVTF